MKKLLILLFTLPLTAFSQQFNFTVKGNVQGILQPVTVFLSYQTNSGYRIDSVRMHDGQFEFHGVSDEPQRAWLSIDVENKGIYKVRPGYKRPLYLEPKPISVVSSDSLANAQVKGGPLNDDHNALLAVLKPSREKMDAIYLAKGSSNELKAAKAAYDQAGLGFIKRHPSTQISFDFLKTYGGSGAEYETLAPVFDLLSASIKNSPKGKAYANKLERMKNVSIGHLAPDFTQADTAGNPISLHDFKGKYVLIDFWASWCGPCRKENPNVVAAYTKYHPKGFAIIGVSLDKPGAKEAWMNAIRKDGLTWTHVSDLKFWENEVSRLYNVSSIPQNVLIAPDGTIIARNLRGESLEQKLSEIFH